MSKGHNRGFTLVEALVSIAILLVGIVSAMSALGSMSRTEAMARDRERMLVLAQEKLEELLATGDAQNAMAGGDFQDYQEDRFRWEATVEPTGVENLQSLIVTVSRVDRGSDITVDAEGLMYVAPQVVEGAGTQ